MFRGVNVCCIQKWIYYNTTKILTPPNSQIHSQKEKEKKENYNYSSQTNKTRMVNLVTLESLFLSVWYSIFSSFFILKYKNNEKEERNDYFVWRTLSNVYYLSFLDLFFSLTLAFNYVFVCSFFDQDAVCGCNCNCDTTNKTFTWKSVLNSVICVRSIFLLNFIDLKIFKSKVSNHTESSSNLVRSTLCMFSCLYNFKGKIPQKPV